MGNVSDVPSHSKASTRCLNADGKPNADSNLPASTAFCKEVPTRLLTVQAQMRQWLSEYQGFDVTTSRKPLELPQAGNLNTYAANVNGGERLGAFQIVWWSRLGVMVSTLVFITSGF